MSSAVACNEQTGNYDVSWTVSNGDWEGRTMTLDQSSRPAVPLSSYAPNESKSYTESLPGDTTGTTTLTVRGDWNNGGPQNVVTSTAVQTDGTCQTPPEPEPERKHTICHATDSTTNPYSGREETITPSKDGVLNGHLDHTGPVPTSQAHLDQLKADHIQWGDIIPPFELDGQTYSLNWTTEGQAIFYNGCALPPEPERAPAIDVTKSCPQAVAFGEDITYTITVTNTGNEALEDVTVNDTLLGDITDEFDVDFSGSFGVGEVATATVSYSPGADEDPVDNTVTASGAGVTSEKVVESEASCRTNVTHAPAIDVTKSCPQTVAFGEDITYTITVTNTGNEALEDVTVNDRLLGDITDEFDVDFSGSFGVGEVATATVSYSPGADEDPVDNTVTASGAGVTSEKVVESEASCRTNVLHPAIDIVKDGPSVVHVDDTITYAFTVTNIGEMELFDVVLSDPICDAGTIVAGADVDSSLSAGGEEVWHFSCSHLVTDVDEDPLPNTATITGDTSEGEGGQEVSDTDDHEVDIIHPGISIVKTVDEEVAPIGATVTFTYVIMNTGDTTLYNVSVDDDILGHIGDIAVLEPGIPVTLTMDYVVTNEIVTNIGTAVGEDVLGRSVSADATATVAPIAGENPPPNNPPTTPFTGSEAGRLGLITMVLFGIGVTVVASTRRRRPKGEAA